MIKNLLVLLLTFMIVIGAKGQAFEIYTTIDPSGALSKQRDSLSRIHLLSGDYSFNYGITSNQQIQTFNAELYINGSLSSVSTVGIGINFYTTTIVGNHKIVLTDALNNSDSITFTVVANQVAYIPGGSCTSGIQPKLSISTYRDTEYVGVNWDKYILIKNGIPVDTAITTVGSYTWTNLPTGSYRISQQYDLWGNTHVLDTSNQQEVINICNPNVAIPIMAVRTSSGGLAGPRPVRRLSNSSNINITEEFAKNKLVLFPNPSNGRITIENGGNTITVLNSLGQIVFNQSNNLQTENLNLGFLSNGVYWLKTEFEIQKFIIKK